MSNLNLMLHCGAEQVERDDQLLTMVPESLGNRHAPFAYSDFISEVEHSFNSMSLQIVQAQFGVLKDGSRFFGLMELQNGFNADDYSIVVGLRASHDQSLAAGIVAGSGVFVCDNLSFSGEVKINTRQTLNVMERMPELVYEATTKVKGLIQFQHARFDAYKSTDLKARAGDAMITELVRRGAINPSQTQRVIEEWDQPSHEEFSEHNVWRLHNAVTEVYKPTNGHTNMARLPQRSIMLTELCDHLSGLNI